MKFFKWDKIKVENKKKHNFKKSTLGDDLKLKPKDWYLEGKKVVEVYSYSNDEWIKIKRNPAL